MLTRPTTGADRIKGRRVSRLGHSFWAIGAVAITVRLVLFLAAGSWSEAALHERVLVGDAPGYHQIAVNVISGRGFSMATVAPFTPDTLRTPGYPSFLVLTYALVGVRPWVALLVQALVSAATCMLAASLACSLWGRRAGNVAGALLALDPVSVMLANQMLSETWFTFLLLLSLTPLLIWRRRMWVAGACMGAAILVRPIAMYLGGLLCLVVAVVVPPKQRGREVLAYAVACLLVLVPWLARNTVLFGTPQLSSFQGENLFVYNAGMLRARIEDRPFDVAKAFHAASQFQGGPFERSRALSAAALRTIGGHPVSYTKLHTVGVGATLFAPGSQQLFKLLGDTRAPVAVVSAASTSSGRLLTRLRSQKSGAQLLYIGLSTCFLLVVYLAAALGAWHMRSHQGHLLLVIVFVVAFLSLAPGPQGEARFRVPLMPLVALAAGAAGRRAVPDAG